MWRPAHCEKLRRNSDHPGINFRHRSKPWPAMLGQEWRQIIPFALLLPLLFSVYVNGITVPFETNVESALKKAEVSGEFRVDGQSVEKFGVAATTAGGVDAVIEAIKAAAEDTEIVQWMLNIRRHLHIYPELSWEAFKTSAFIREPLDELGEWSIAKTGIVVMIGAGNAPVIAHSQIKNFGVSLICNLQEISKSLEDKLAEVMKGTECASRPFAGQSRLLE